MMVAASRATNAKQRIYHRCGCMYARRIQPQNRLEMSRNKAQKRHYRECRFCAGLKGDVYVHRKAFADRAARKHMTFTYRKDTDTLYIRTEVGFWKVFLKAELGQYLLYHRNYYRAGMDFEQAIRGDFHRQTDVKATESLEKIVGYIIDHDRAKVTILDDYRKLPQNTKLQRKYYRAAERRVKRDERRRLDRAFEMLERAEPGIREYSVW